MPHMFSDANQRADRAKAQYDGDTVERIAHQPPPQAGRPGEHLLKS